MRIIAPTAPSIARTTGRLAPLTSTCRSARADAHEVPHG